MCLSLPGKVEFIEGNKGRVSISGNIIDVNLQLLEDVEVNDYVLVHAGFALEKIDPDEAAYLLNLFEELGENFNQE